MTLNLSLISADQSSRGTSTSLERNTLDSIEIERINRITGVIHSLLQGHDPDTLDCESEPEDEIHELSLKVNRLLHQLREVKEFILPLSSGKLGYTLPRNNFLASPFKQLQASLRHLTWQTQQIAQGDFNQRVDFMGDFSTSFNTMVDALGEARNQLIAEVSHAEQLAEVKGHYLNVMAHDIRTPLAAILGIAEILLENLPVNERKAHIETIRRNGSALIDLINNILDLAKLEKGKLEISAQPFSIRELAEDLRGMFVPSLPEAVQFRLDVDDDIPSKINGDPQRLRQILINLVGNAVKFTREGYIALEVRELDREGENRSICFKVQDTGIGVSDAAIKRIFSPFKQASRDISIRYGGSGLGLSIARELVGLMGGELGVESRVDSGTTFFFTIQLQAVAEDLPVEQGEVTANAEEPYKSEDPDLMGIRVIVVDDNPINRMLVKRMLAKLGAAVVEKASGADGIEAVLKDPPDVVLMDQNMPGMSGNEAIRRLRAVFEPSELTILALTADGSSECRELLMESGADEILYKPIDKQRTYRFLARFLKPLLIR